MSLKIYFGEVSNMCFTHKHLNKVVLWHYQNIIITPQKCLGHSLISAGPWKEVSDQLMDLSSTWKGKCLTPSADFRDASWSITSNAVKQVGLTETALSRYHLYAIKCIHLNDFSLSKFAEHSCCHDRLIPTTTGSPIVPIRSQHPAPCPAQPPGGCFSLSIRLLDILQMESYRTWSLMLGFEWRFVICPFYGMYQLISLLLTNIL